MNEKTKETVKNVTELLIIGVNAILTAYLKKKK